MASAGYAHPELLAEPDWLAAHVNDPDVRMIDCATLEAYRRAHIPGAVGLPVHIYIKDPADETFVMPPEGFEQLMGRLGVNNDTTVVTYDDNNALVATRLWWVLNYYGHTKTKVLNGGWHRWLTEGRPVTFHQTHAEPATFHAKPNEDLICRVDGLKAKIGKTGTQILDVRTDEEWRGANNRGNTRAGHVPGAVHLEWLNFVTKDDRRTFLPAEQLRSMLTKEGISPESEVVTY